MNRNTIAIIGSGITGSVAALMLADQGFRVCLFDKAPVPMSGASLVNEGKIHLGFVYVNDPSMRSLDIMIETAVVFRKIMERWITAKNFDALVTKPFEYIVPLDTQVAPDVIDWKLGLIADKIAVAENRHNTRYLGMERTEPWSRSVKVTKHYHQKNIIAHYRTMERSVDTRAIANHLTQCLEKHDRIELHLNTAISKVYRDKRGWWVESNHLDKPERFGPFSKVVNSSWEGRPELDKQVFGPDKHRWFHRFKTALNLHMGACSTIPNFTAIIGTYGDIVTYPSGRMYLSYYPAGMLSSSDTIGGVKVNYSHEIKTRVAAETIAGLSQFIPDLKEAFASYEPNGDDVAGGIIMARGKTDIDDSESELHQRYRIGIQESDGYYTIDTGKYTCGPAFAEQVVNRIKNSFAV
jgi:signal peptidase I